MHISHWFVLNNNRSTIAHPNATVLLPVESAEMPGFQVQKTGKALLAGYWSSVSVWQAHKLIWNTGIFFSSVVSSFPLFLLSSSFIKAMS